MTSESLRDRRRSEILGHRKLDADKEEEIRIQSEHITEQTRTYQVERESLTARLLSQRQELDAANKDRADLQDSLTAAALEYELLLRQTNRPSSSSRASDQLLRNIHR